MEVVVQMEFVQLHFAEFRPAVETVAVLHSLGSGHLRLSAMATFRPLEWVVNFKLLPLL